MQTGRADVAVGEHEPSPAPDEVGRRTAELEAVVEASPDAILVGDDRGIRYANRAALEMLGFDDVERLNAEFGTIAERLDIRDIDTREPSAPAHQAFPRALRGEVTDREAIIRHQKTGKEVFVRSRGAPIRRDGAVVGAVAVLTDITPLRHRQHELRLIADAIPVHLLHVDRDERILFANRAAAAAWQLHPRDMIGKTIGEVIGDEGRRALKPFAERVLRGFQTPDGVEYYLNTYVPDRGADGTVRGFLATGTNITERKRSEEVVRASRAREEASRKRLEEERRVREQFVSTLTHDLRTPLSAAKVAAELILRQADDPHRVRKLAARIMEGVERMDVMMRDLLDASAIRAGAKLSVNRGACDLASVAHDVVEELATVHGARFRLEAQEPFRGNWDCAALRRVFENLCTNAVKYGAPDAPVLIRIGRTSDAVEVAVHNDNDGEPIPPALVPTLFEPFRRAPSASTSGERGWGLGLTLVKGIVEAHGGTVEVTSDTDDGTTFRIRLPSS